jgi:hypothetical protein
MLKARCRAGLTQDAVAERMGALQKAQFHGSNPPANMRRRLRRYVEAVGCNL